MTTFQDTPKRNLEDYFIPENQILDELDTFDSPSGQFRLEITSYRTTPQIWTMTRGIVTATQSGVIIADIKRNYSAFWHSWVKHRNGHEYLLCGEDYQGYTVIDLTESSVKSYLPPEAKDGTGFCWASVYPSPDGAILAVDGCYWAFPYELVLYDFSKPDQLPFPILGRFEGLEQINGWKTNHLLKFTISYEARESDGKKYMDLSDEEQRVLDLNATLSCVVKEEHEWERKF